MILTYQLIPCSSSQLDAILSPLMTLMAANQRREKDATAPKQESKEESVAMPFFSKLKASVFFNASSMAFLFS